MQFIRNTFLFQFFPSATLRYSCPRTCRFYELASLARVISSLSGLRFLLSFLFSLSHSKQAMYGFIALAISLSRIYKLFFTTQYSVRYSSFDSKSSFFRFYLIEYACHVFALNIRSSTRYELIRKSM